MKKTIFAAALIFSVCGFIYSDGAAAFSRDELTGRVDPSKNAAFAVIPSKYASQKGFWMRREALDAFVRMHDAAAKDGVSLVIVSAFRSFDDQKGIWDAKWSGERLVEGKNLAKTVKDPVERARTILRFSSMPSTSRHHWGTDVDLNALEDSYFLKGKGKAEFDWLTKNAAAYGFARSYTKKGADRPTGYEEEKWHWSYLPLSRPMLAAWLSNVTAADMRGFSGSDTVGVRDYVGGVDGSCR